MSVLIMQMSWADSEKRKTIGSASHQLMANFPCLHLHNECINYANSFQASLWIANWPIRVERNEAIGSIGADNLLIVRRISPRRHDAIFSSCGPSGRETRLLQRCRSVGIERCCAEIRGACEEARGRWEVGGWKGQSLTANQEPSWSTDRGWGPFRRCQIKSNKKPPAQ